MIPVILIQITPEERTPSVLFKEESSWKGVKEGDYLKKDKGLLPTIPREGDEAAAS